jgi:hypothetical protein
VFFNHAKVFYIPNFKVYGKLGRLREGNVVRPGALDYRSSASGYPELSTEEVWAWIQTGDLEVCLSLTEIIVIEHDLRRQELSGIPYGQS